MYMYLASERKYIYVHTVLQTKRVEHFLVDTAQGDEDYHKASIYIKTRVVTAAVNNR